MCEIVCPGSSIQVLESHGKESLNNLRPPSPYGLLRNGSHTDIVKIYCSW